MMAWNNLVMNADPDLYEIGDERRSAAIACRYMAEANNGGLNAFLTSSWDLDVQEVLQALYEIGAASAADEFRLVLERLGQNLPAATQEQRWAVLENLWTDGLDEIDTLTIEADQSLVAALEAHVSRHTEYYSNLTIKD